jgi:hypothetical protein
MTLLCVAESWSLSANCGAQAEYAYCVLLVQYTGVMAGRGRGRGRTFVPQASAIAVAATTDTTRVFLWGMVFSWSIMAGSEGVVSRSRGNHLGKVGD